MSNELIQEVEESLRQERIEKFFKEYGPYILAGAILAVLITAFISGMQYMQNKANRSGTTAIIQALNEDNSLQALGAVMKDLQTGQRTVAGMTVAGIQLSEDKQIEALASFKKIAADTTISEVYKGLAALMVVRLEWQLKGDEANPQEMLSQLSALWTGDNVPWQWHARIQAAVINAHGLGNYDAAIKHLVLIEQQKGLPDTLTKRAAALYHIYSLKNSRRSENKNKNDGKNTVQEKTIKGAAE